MKLYAWVGEDEFGSGVVGLKIGIVPAGNIPLVCIESDKPKLLREGIIGQMQIQASTFGKTIRLAEFTWTGDVMELKP